MTSCFFYSQKVTKDRLSTKPIDYQVRETDYLFHFWNILPKRQVLYCKPHTNLKHLICCSEQKPCTSTNYSTSQDFPPHSSLPQSAIENSFPSATNYTTFHSCGAQALLSPILSKVLLGRFWISSFFSCEFKVSGNPCSVPEVTNKLCCYEWPLANTINLASSIWF